MSQSSTFQVRFTEGRLMLLMRRPCRRRKKRPEHCRIVFLAVPFLEATVNSRLLQGGLKTQSSMSLRRKAAFGV